MKRLRLAVLGLVLTGALAGSGMAQLSEGGMPVSFNKATLPAPPAAVMPSIDLAALAIEDSAELEQGLPYRFGQPFEVDYSIYNSGEWIVLPDSSKLWRLRIEAPGAYSINLIYSAYRLPRGARLFLYDGNRETVLGAFTARNNKRGGKFATAPTKGDVVTIEYQVPAHVSHPGELTISQVVHGYKDAFFYDRSAKAFGSSGSCNNNVACPEGAPWANEIRSVAMVMLGGIRLCTGSLLNNVRNDFTPYFLSAHHCHGSVPSNDPETWIIVFNYQSPTCASQDGPLYYSLSGTSLIATNSSSDFTLLRLDEDPPDSFQVYFSGWSAQTTASQSSTCIHHPSGDVKKISFDTDPVTSASYTSLINGHWRVVDWDDGTTEPGSSGSPLYDQNHRVVGQLHGGEAACGNSLSDYYGKFDRSWNIGSTSSGRLRDWLDPDNTGTLTVDGIDGLSVSFVADTTYGQIPLTVGFSPTTVEAPSSYLWEFGDGGVSADSAPTHLYDEAGLFDVSLSVSVTSGDLTRVRAGYILALADTLVGSDQAVSPGQQVEITISATNNFPLDKIVIPFDWSGDLDLRYDSFVTTGCRTDYFAIKELYFFDDIAKQGIIRLETASNGSQAELVAGTGAVLKLVMTADSGATSGQSTTIQIDGPLTQTPIFEGSLASYTPATIHGTVSISGCCIGQRGNANNDVEDSFDVADILYLVEYSFGIPAGPAPECVEEADVNGSGSLDVVDIVYMVEYSFSDPSGPAPVDCP